jgi:DNA gyrase/topoisomerase IV subunit A
MLVLIEKNLIQNYYDLSKDGKIRYVVQFSKGQLKRIYQDKWKFFKLFRLYTEIPKDILNCILEDGIKWIHFDNPYQLIDVFVEKRLKYYFIRKKRMIEDIEKKLKDLKEKMLFITLVVTNKIIINKRSQTEIKKDLDLYNIGYDVLKLTIGRLTKDEIDKLEKEIEDLTQRLEDIKLTPEKTMYMQDLIELKEKFCEVNVIKV